MSAPFVTLTFGRIKEGKLEDFRRLNRQIVELVEKNEPRVIAFHALLSEDGERVAGMQFHPDAASMEFHLRVVRQATAEAADVLEIEEFKVLGQSSEVIEGLMKAMGEAGVKVEHLPVHVGGFTRSAALDS